MSTRDELAEWLFNYKTDRAGWRAVSPVMREGWARDADALIAEGWRKKPSESEVARALSLAMAENPYTWEEVPTEMCPDDRDGTTKLVKTLHLNPLVDAILALMDRGQ